MVNRLLTAVQTNIDLGADITLGEAAMKTITLKGGPADLQCKPFEAEERVSNKFKIATAPYSF